jgi:hypothetical protein
MARPPGAGRSLPEEASVPNPAGGPQITPEEPEHIGSRRDPEERPTTAAHEVHDQMLDKALADSFPTSDPPSTIQSPGTSGHCAESNRKALLEKLILDIPPRTWVAVSIDEQRVVGTGRTTEEAEQKARADGHLKLWLVQVPEDAPMEHTPEQAA